MSGGGWDLEEIRQRADIVEIVSPHVRLRKAGRRLVGLCPFHQERTPSFTVDPESGLWHCFGCKAGGDLFRFVEMIEKVSFAEAVELLARRLGLPPRRPADAARQRQRERLLALHEEACSFFESQLTSDAGKRARAYLRQRGLNRVSVEEFRLGYAPDSWDGLLNAMAKRAFKGEELARAGLAVAREGAPSQGFYDRFRDRIIFPIQDAGGRVIAFGGRSLSDDQQPKYLNSPETLLFQKGHTLWAFDRARRAMADAERAIVVEGYLDAIACHEAGLRETVATMGTALTSGHVELLRRRVERLVLAFDSDSAGLSAAMRARELFQQSGLSVRVVSLPEGADPDAVIRGRGAEVFQGLVAAAVPVVEWELGRILRRAEGKDQGERIEVLGEAVSALARVAAGVEREYYVRWLAQEWSADAPDRRMAMEAAIREELARRMTREGARARRTYDSSRGETAVTNHPDVARPAASRVQVMVLAAFLQYGELAARYVPALEAEDFGGGEEREIFEVIQRLVESREPVAADAVLARLAPGAGQALAGLALEEVPAERVEESIASGVKRLVEARLRRREGVLLRMLEKAATQEEREAIRGELSEVTSKRSELAGQRLVGDW